MLPMMIATFILACVWVDACQTMTAAKIPGFKEYDPLWRWLLPRPLLMLAFLFGTTAAVYAIALTFGKVWPLGTSAVFMLLLIYRAAIAYHGYKELHK